MYLCSIANLQPSVQEDCCERCPMLLAVTTMPTTSTTTTSTSTTTTGPTTTPPECVDADQNACNAIQVRDCYDDSIRETCCARCTALHNVSTICSCNDTQILKRCDSIRFLHYNNSK